MSRSAEASHCLLTVLSSAERGPRRDGTFAVWLTVRVAVDLADQPDWGERSHRKRVQALERRLTSLNLPPSLRRALSGTLSQLRNLNRDAAAMALTQLVAPVRESLNGEAAEAVRRVAVSLRGK